MAEKITSKFVFPKTINLLLPVLVVIVLGLGAYVPVVVGIGMSPEATDVGYQPIQPVPYSHALHVGKLGMDCKYCHNTVDQAAFAAIPPTQTCMNCHTNIKTTSQALAPVRESWATGKPVEWVKVHDLADFSYFNHSAHVNKGVSCVECHSRIDHMEVVYQAKNLSMSWCLDCHRNTQDHLRPVDQVTNLGWKLEDLFDPAKTKPGTPSFQIAQDLKAAHPGETITQTLLGQHLKDVYKIRDVQFMTSCSTCHR